MSRKRPLNTNVRPHLLVAAAAAVWITLFLVVVGPFDSAPLPMAWRAQVMLGYGLVFFVCYALAIPFQNAWYRRMQNWTSWQELVFYLLIFGACLPACFAYYSSDLINGDFSFSRFALEVYLPTLLILLPLLIISRRFVNALPVDDKRPRSLSKNEDTDIAYWKPRLEQLMEKGEYLNADLSLKTIAKQLGTNSSVLSRVINQGYGSNFNDFINAYRVEAVQRALEKGEHKIHTLAGIARDCGFSSKATFNRAFKKQLQLSPSDYIRQLEKGSE